MCNYDDHDDDDDDNDDDDDDDDGDDGNAGECGEGVSAERQAVTCEDGRGISRHTDWFRFLLALHQLSDSDDPPRPQLTDCVPDASYSARI